MKESSLQSIVLKYLNSLENCVAENVSGNSQQSGRPDINGSYKGRSFRIELKVLNNKPTKKQMINLIKWFRAGSAICVAYSLKDVKEFIDNFVTDFVVDLNWKKLYVNSCCAFGLYKEREDTYDFFKEYKKLHTQD